MECVVLFFIGIAVGLALRPAFTAGYEKGLGRKKK